MSRSVTMVVIAVALVAPALLYSWTSSAGTGPGRIKLTSRETSRVRIDLGKPGRGVGDTEVVRQNLFNLRLRESPIGSAEYVCTFTTSTTRACTVTFFLPRGRIMAGGSIRYQELYELAIIGGTRLYDNGRGTLNVIRTTRRPRRQILVFRLTG
jgi:hypothetical protein